MEMPTHAWVFPARMCRVVDGDTLDIEIDQGMHSYRLERVRLLGVNAPERKGPTREAGLAATLWLINWFERDVVSDWPLLVHTEKSDAFGRYVARIWARASGQELNAELIAAGHALVDIR